MNGYCLPARGLPHGDPLVVLVSLRSANRKTGAMLQTWILRADMDPVRAVRERRDRAICGTCPQRWNLGGACYVVPARAPLAAWRAWRRGNYEPLPVVAPPKHRGRLLRMGAYGDPCAVPAEQWRRIFAALEPSGWTGYTRMWASPWAQWAREQCMASVLNPSEFRLARRMGWRTFRTRTPHDPLLPGEFICPASAEAGHRLTCDTCMACNGDPHDRPRAGTVVIVEHGQKALK